MGTWARIGVIGLGLIGGSVAKAFAAAGVAVWGYDVDPTAVAAARKDRTLMDGSHDWREWIDQVDAVFVASPLETVEAWLGELAGVARVPNIIIELSSVKSPLIPALQQLPTFLTPLSLHPMAGRERSGYEAAQSDLFKGFTCAAVPIPGRPMAREAAEEVAGVLGMQLVVVDPQTHDLVVATTSHLPYLVSAALLVTAGKQFAVQAPWPELVGPGFMDTTRVGASRGSLLQPILLANRQALLPALEQYIEILQSWHELLQQSRPIAAIEHEPAMIRGLAEGRRDPR